MRPVNLVSSVFRAVETMNRWSEPAIVCDETTVSYAYLLSSVKKFGAMIRALGIEGGDRVAIVASDCPQWIVSFLGTVMVGAVSVPVSTMLTPLELKYVLNHSGAKALVTTSEQLEKLRAIRNELAQLESVLLIDGESDDTLNFELTSKSSPAAEIETVSDETLAFILYTSGSTGKPKGAMHVHRSLPYTVETCCKQILDVGPADRLFSSSRLFFAYGLGNSLSFPLASCATSILCKARPTPSLIADVFERHRPTVFFGVPAVFRSLLEYASQGNSINTDSIKFCISAGEKLPETIFYEWKGLTGLDILDGIGSTEMLQMFISNRRGRLKAGSSGQVISGYEAKLLDKEENPVVGAGAGQLLIRGGSACTGYWNDPAKTASTIQDGWVRSGDMYRRDDDQFYWFEGRSDDLFKVKGLWVSPIEVEEALLSCPEVVEAAVVPGLNRDGMNSVIAYVVLRSGSVSEDDAAASMKAAVSKTLPSYKCPAEVRFVPHLPRTATGKLQRFKLREHGSDSI
jgi:benzoate-CoA ligase family protein